MNFFLDTSALVKLFHLERGSEVVSQLISRPESQIWVLDLVRAEFSSALHRRYRNHEIDKTQLHAALSGFYEQLRLFNVHPLEASVVDQAVSLLTHYGKTMGLRALDALQLGAYSLLQELGWSFVCADKILASTAERAGFTVINPTTSAL